MNHRIKNIGLIVLASAMVTGCQTARSTNLHAGRAHSANAYLQDHSAMASHAAGMASSPSHPGHMASQVQQASVNSDGTQVTTADYRAVTGAPSQVHPAGCSQCQSQCYQPMFPTFANESACGACNSDVRSNYRDPQEYIFDGGDHAPRVRVNEDMTVVGLDAEDTVVHYETMRGNICVEPACRAAIYAPRFGTVRKITAVNQNDRYLAAQATIKPQFAGKIEENLPPITSTKPLAVRREDGVRLVESFKDRNRGVPFEKVLPVLDVSESLSPFEDFQLIRTGKTLETDVIRLRRSVAAALAWSNVDRLQVIVDGQAAEVNVEVKEAAETVLYELGGKPRVRICKVASDQLANPGDIIDFTIRFDNVGDQEVGKLVILDSLPPRLEYFENSQKCSLKSKFSTSDNSVGSSTLRWEIEPKLKPSEGGVIRFQCKVR